MNPSKFLHSPLVKSIYKRSGITPLQAIHEFKIQHPEYKDEKMSYAGRLDPMADGVLVLLIGDANKKRNDFLQLQKTYRVEILFGIATDSYDVLGIPTDIDNVTLVKEEEFADILRGFNGKYVQQFPPYSSKPVRGKPLYYWARKNLLDDIELPTKERVIDSISAISWRRLEGNAILTNVLERIADVEGDFRKSETIQAWKILLEDRKNDMFQLVTIEVSGSSGLYMRQLCVDIGKQLSIPTLAFKITRTRVGDFEISERLSD